MCFLLKFSDVPAIILGITLQNEISDFSVLLNICDDFTCITSYFNNKQLYNVFSERKTVYYYNCVEINQLVLRHMLPSMNN